MRLPIAALAAALLLAPSISWAEFILQSPSPAVAERPTVRRARPTLSKRPAPVPLAEGFGHGVPLSIAIEQIVPSSVSVQYAPGVDKDQVVNWSGGKPWPDVVRSALHRANLKATIAGNSIRVDPETD